MGMFDNISVADKLPVTPEMVAAGFGENNLGYQTKNFDRALDSYIIQGGRLFQVDYKVREWRDDPTNPFGGHIAKEGEYLKELPHYHGVINFYTHESRGNTSYWIEYDATFTEGKMTSIRLKNFHSNDITERNAAIAKIFSDAEAKKKLYRNKYLFHTKVWWKVRRFFYYVFEKIEFLASRAKFYIR